MCLPCRAPLLLLLLLCASSVLAQEQGIPNAIEGVDLKLIDEHTALQKAEKQEEATEHAPISHEQAPAALEDVDEFKGGSSSVSESEVEHEKEMDHENEDNEHGHDHPSDAAHISTALSTLSGAYAVAVPVQSPGSEATISSPDCLVSAGAEACSGHGVCQLNPGSEQHFCECTEGWFGPHCQCGEQPDECSESNHCHWCGPLSLCLTSKEECEAGESALHGQEHHNLDTLPHRVEDAAEKVPEHQVLPQVDAEISAMEHQEKAYETQGASRGNKGLIYRYWKKNNNGAFPFSLNSRGRDTSGYDHL